MNYEYDMNCYELCGTSRTCYLDMSTVYVNFIFLAGFRRQLLLFKKLNRRPADAQIAQSIELNHKDSSSQSSLESSNPPASLHCLEHKEATKWKDRPKEDKTNL